MRHGVVGKAGDPGVRPRRAEGPAPQRRLACDHHRATLLRTCCCHRLL